MELVITIFGFVMDAEPSQAFGLVASITVSGDAGCAHALFNTKSIERTASDNRFFMLYLFNYK
jgi:hypothetical protein